MRQAAVPGGRQRGPGRQARRAIGSPAAGWFAATFLAGAVVALLIALLAKPSSTVVSPVANRVAFRTGTIHVRGGIPPSSQWTVLPGGALPPGVSQGVLGGRFCQAAVAVPRVIRGKAGRVQVVLPRSAAVGPFARRLVMLPAGAPPFAIGQVVLPRRMIAAVPSGGPAGIQVPASRVINLPAGQRMSWVQAPSFTVIRGRSGQITVQLGKPGVPGQVRSWVAVPGGLPAAFNQGICGARAAQVYVP